MPKDDEAVDTTNVDESTVDESTDQPEAPVQDEPKVELDKPTEIEGDLIENPTLEEESDESTEEPETPDKPAEGEGEDSEEEQPEAPEETPEEVEPEEDTTGVYAPPKQDPGDFQPKNDYSFEVQTLDGKTIKINTPDEAEAFAKRLDTEDNLLGAYQFTQFQRNVLKMDTGLDRERSEYEAQKQEFETQQEQIRVRDEQVTQWNNEVNYLRSKGMLPKITPEQNASNWTDPKNAEVPAIKETLAIFNWMQNENNARREAGIPEVTSAVDAYRMMQAEQVESAAETERQQQTTTRQRKGAVVGGNASSTPANEQSNSIVGEGGSLQDLVREYSW